MSTLNLGPANNFYGDGINSSAGENTVRHYYDRVGIRAATAKNIYGQFASRKEMPKNSGKEYKISKFLNGYDRKRGEADFNKYGYMTGRDLSDYRNELASAVSLTEGAGAVNKRKLEKITLSTKVARYGEMLEYTDEVDMFSEDVMQTRYHEFMGNLANERNESLIQMDMLSTPTVIYAGLSQSRKLLGANPYASNHASYTAYETNRANGAYDDKFKVSYDLIRQGVRRLVANRAKKNTEIVTGTVKIDSRTIAPAYYAIVGPEVKSDLEMLYRGTKDINGSTTYMWIPAHQYASGTTLAEGEVGLIHEVRFIESESAFVYRGAGAKVPTGYQGNLSHSPLGSSDGVVGAYNRTTVELSSEATGPKSFTATKGSETINYTINPGELVELKVGYTTSVTGDHVTTTTRTAAEEYFDVFPILFPTQDAFATVGLKGVGKITFNSKPPSDVSIVNPYGTQGFFSYNFWYAGILLEPEKLLKMEVLASA
jgi:N4-gp56 family major capsid protein